MRSKVSDSLWGLIFIMAGVVFAGNAFDLWDFNLFFEGWWTLFIIVPCSISLIKNGFRLWTVIGLIIGILLLLSQRELLDGDVIRSLIVPLIFVCIGISMIFKNFFQKEGGLHIDVKYQGGASEYTAIFGGNEQQITGEKFFGTTITAIFGGVELDLRNAIIEEDIVINATAIFGGIDLMVPQNVKVKVSNVPIFGGVDNKAMKTLDPNAPTIFVNSTCMFGGIDIK